MATTVKTGMDYIGGQWVAGSSPETLEDRNPSHTSELLGLFPRSGEKEVDAAVKAAREAFAPWRRLSRIKHAESWTSLYSL